MLLIALFVGALAILAAAGAAHHTLRALPRSNEDWVWY